MKTNTYDRLKRCFDIAFALLAMVALAMILVSLFILIRTKIGSPAIYSQIRTGRDGKPFRLYKFRSMTNERDESGMLLPDEERLTVFGKKLRSTSLDELPEFYNVFKGDMSVIGPRPLLMKYVKHYNQRQKRRHDVMPGITGWVQVNGRNALTWDERFEMDVWYVENRSLSIDIKILFKTITVVLSRDGISQENHVTMEEFHGNDRLA